MGALLSSSTVSVTSEGILSFLGPIYGLRSLQDLKTTHHGCVNKWTVCNPSLPPISPTTHLEAGMQGEGAEGRGWGLQLPSHSAGREFLAHGRPHGWLCAWPLEGAQDSCNLASDRGGSRETNESPGREDRMQPVSDLARALGEVPGPTFAGKKAIPD